MNDIQCTP